jgi:AcrR family transcriptional regulator
MSTVTDSDKAHPTHQALISTVKRLLETKDDRDLTVEEILAESGVSTGSLYHHFADLQDLIDQTIIAQCAEITDYNIVAIEQLTSAATDKQSLSALLRRYLTVVVGPSQRNERGVRTRALARATGNERFRKMLAEENARVFAVVAEFVKVLQVRGIVNRDVGPMAVAVFAMAYTIGVVVNDLASEPVKDVDMVALIASFYDKVVIAE